MNLGGRLICLGVPIVLLSVLLVVWCSQDISESEAIALTSKIRGGMTFREIQRVIPLSEMHRTLGGEHGGDWYRVPLSSRYVLELRFSRGTTSTRVLNYSPRLKDRRTHVLIAGGGASPMFETAQPVSCSVPLEDKRQTEIATPRTELSFVLKKGDLAIRVEPRDGGRRFGIRIGDSELHEWLLPGGGTIVRMKVCRWVPHREQQIGLAVGLQVASPKEGSHQFYVAVFAIDLAVNKDGALWSVLPERAISDAPFHFVKRAGLSDQPRLAGISNPAGDTVQMVILTTDSDRRIRAEVYSNPCPIATFENTVFSLVTEKVSKETLFRRPTDESSRRLKKNGAPPKETGRQDDRGNEK